MKDGFLVPLLFLSLLAAGNLHAQFKTPVVGGVMGAVSSLCGGISTMVPVVAMLMTVVGGVVYASGQMMGAETRARANVWATAALVGAVTMMLIIAITPPVLKAIYPDLRGDCSYVCAGGGSGISRVVPAGSVCCVAGSGSDWWGYGCPSDYPTCQLRSPQGWCCQGATCQFCGAWCGTDCTSPTDCRNVP